MKTLTFALFLLLGIHLPSPAQLSSLNDEFDDPYLFSLHWNNINDVEGWDISQLEQCRIDTVGSGRLVLQPYTCTWEKDKKGPFLFKPMQGDFIFTTEVTISNRKGKGLPKSEFSMAGCMIRVPKNIRDPAWWDPGQENYIYLTTGYATSRYTSCDPCPAPHLEAKSTVNSVSLSRITSLGSSTVTLRIARIENTIFLLYREPGGSFQVLESYERPDFPNTLQVGLIGYTDWRKARTFTDDFHNRHTLTAPLPVGSPNDTQVDFSPDLQARFDYARFEEVSVPTHLDRNDLSRATPEELLRFLGKDPIIASAPAPAATTRYISIWKPAAGKQLEIRGLRQKVFLDTLPPLAKRNYHLAKVLVYFQDGKWRYDGVWRQGGGPSAFYQMENWETFKSWTRVMAQKGFELAQIEIFGDETHPYYAGVWRASESEKILYGTSKWKSFRKKCEKRAASDYHLTDVEVFPFGASGWVAGIWEKGGRTSRMVLKEDWETFVSQWKEYEAKGIYLTDIETFERDGTRWYIGIGRENAPPGQLLLHPSWDDLRVKTEEMKAQGLQLEDLERMK